MLLQGGDFRADALLFLEIAFEVAGHLGDAFGAVQADSLVAERLAHGAGPVAGSVDTDTPRLWPHACTQGPDVHKSVTASMRSLS